VTFYLDGAADGTATGSPGFTATVMGDDQWSENYASIIVHVEVKRRASVLAA
jgi:hypothetical protein